ncbi:MAG: hypothetical protein ACREN5_13290 [Gemmatimonadales bacterium]
MDDPVLRERLVAHALAGRYGGFIRGGTLATVVGLVLFLVALLSGRADRAWHAFHWNWLFFTSLAGGSVALVAVHKLARAKWSGLLLRFAEAGAAFLPISLLGLVLIFTVGYDAIYGTLLEQLHGIQRAKAVWLSHGFMIGRLLVVLGVLFTMGWALVRADLIPDLFLAKAKADPTRRALFERWATGFDGSVEARDRLQSRIARYAAMYIVLYALGFTLVAFDMVMALQPHWFSNLLGGFFFMGAFLSAHTLLVLTMLYGERQLGLAELISPKQRHDLGKLCFGFTVFWTYLMWSQYLVIWYGNLPEETGFVFARLWGPWRPVGVWVFLGMFLIPFFGLLGVASKKARLTLGLFAGISLFTFWTERYLLVMPSITAEHGPALGFPELAAVLLLGGLFLLSYGTFARIFPMVSPRLAEITLDREVHHVVETHEFEHDEGPKDYVSEEAIEHEKEGE